MDETEQLPSTKPYFIRAIYEWCTDNGFTPYLAVKVEGNVQVPMEYVHEGQIVLNISFDSTSGMELANDYISFQARFAGAVRDIIVPVDHVLAIYAKENGQGMAFAVSDDVAHSEADSSDNLEEQIAEPPALHLVDDSEGNTSKVQDDDEPEPTPPENRGKGKKPTLRLVK